jgi:murein DD-endopeptidase MepM/ murein hydrolase activator NlpD
MGLMKKNIKNQNNLTLKISALILIAGFNLFVYSFSCLPLRAQEDGQITELNQKIDTKKQEIDKLQQKIDAYEEKIKIKQKDIKSLKSQIALLDNDIAKINLDIQATQARIEQTNLEIQSLNLQIKEVQKNIDENKNKIAEYIRLINKNDRVSYLEVILTNNSFSDFFNQLQYTEQIHGDLKKTLDKQQVDKTNLELQKSNWQEKSDLENKLKDDLQKQKAGLSEKNTAQQTLLLQSRLTERQYQNSLYQLQAEQQQINNEITSLESSIRKKLEAQQEKEKFNSFGPARLGWPVDPGRGITAYFHDPDYPFRYIYEHPAIDIRTPQSTPIKAPEAGYVGQVKFKGDKSYAYVMIIHNDGLSTVFGHISAVYVKADEYVKKGQVIALSGGSPGTIGAGNLTTGPHLHFEVRFNGIPVNPLEYLP